MIWNEQIQPTGDNHHRTIYSDDAVRQIHDMRASKVSYKAISKITGVNYWTARKIGYGGRRSKNCYRQNKAP